MFCRRHSCPFTYVGLERGFALYRCVRGGHLKRVRKPPILEPKVA
jgi:hypothetical protein